MDTAMTSEGKRKISMNVPRSLWRSMRITAAAQDKTVTELVEEWLTERLQQEARRSQAIPNASRPPN